VGAVQRLFSVTESGDVSVSTFSDPFSSIFAVFSGVTTDSASTRIFLASFFSAFALDASTGAVRWSVRHPITFDGSTLEAPIISTLRGSTPLVDLFYKYDTPTSTAFAREVVRDLTTGTVVRESVRKERADQVAYIGQCGDDGIVIVRTTGRFLFSNIRTGVDTEGIIREPTSSANVILSQFDEAASSFTGGYLVLLTSNGVLGFKCHP
jgi:outer membrane protein assembly factor BamB